MPPPIGWYSTRQVRKATKAGMAQGSIRNERKMPRPGRFWCTSSARPSPMPSFSTSDTSTMTMVFQMAL